MQQASSEGFIAIVQPKREVENDVSLVNQTPNLKPYPNTTPSIPPCPPSTHT